MISTTLAHSFLIVGAGFIAGLAPLFFRWNHETAHRWIAFGAGALLGAGFLHMLPEGYELAGPKGLSFVLLGFIVLYLIEQITLRHPHEEDAGEFHEIGILAFLGLTLHDLVDGIALGSGEHAPDVSSAIFLGLILHKIPMTFSLSVLLVHGGYRPARVLLLLTVVLLALPAGALLSDVVVQINDSDFMIGSLILFSTGTFLYIAAYELLPEMHRKSASDRLIGVFFIIGLATMFLLRLIH